MTTPPPNTTTTTTTTTTFGIDSSIYGGITTEFTKVKNLTIITIKGLPNE